MRQSTATIASLPLITASVLSKKFAVGSEGLVVDVKWGNGSFLRDLEQAKLSLKDFKNKMVELGENIGVSIHVQHEDIFNVMHKI